MIKPSRCVLRLRLRDPRQLPIATLVALATQVDGAVLEAAACARMTPVASEQNARVPVAVTPEKVAGAAPVT